MVYFALEFLLLRANCPELRNLLILLVCRNFTSKFVQVAELRAPPLPGKIRKGSKTGLLTVNENY